MSNIFELDKISYSYAESREALSEITLEIKEGEIFTIIGSNGSGKSTLLHLFGGLLFPKKGIIRYNGKEVTEDKLKDVNFNKYFRSTIGFVFQNPDIQLFCPTVLDELLFAPIQAGMDMQIANERAHQVMEMLEISHLAERPTYMLSGGEKKRVAIGSILTTNPDVLLLDEPTSGLDPKTRSFIIELIFQLNEVGKTIIITTHNLEMVDHFQSRAGILSEMHKLERVGNSTEIIADLDFLVSMNLISNHVHRHGNKIHSHLLTGLSHKHNEK